MNTNKLSTLYPTLDPTERLSLLLAAAARGDDVEHTRLMDSAPRVTFRVPHTFGRATAFQIVCGHHRMEQLNLAALFFKTSALAEAMWDQSDRLSEVSQVYAYLVKINNAGWKLFCERERLDPLFGMSPLPGDEVVEVAAKEAEVLAYTAEEVLEYGRRKGQSFDKLKTVESIAEELGMIFEMWVEHWA